MDSPEKDPMDPLDPNATALIALKKKPVLLITWSLISMFVYLTTITIEIEYETFRIVYVLMFALVEMG